MNCSGVEHKDQFYYSSLSTPSSTQSSFFNSQKVRGAEVDVKLQREAEQSSNNLPHLLINGLPAQGLKLEYDDHHSNSFNEVVRRIKSSKQIKISEKISQVTEEQMGKVIQCRDNPALILNGYHEFFTSDEFPYVNLRAFRDGKITVNEFATLASLHSIYQENCEETESFEMKFEALFDQNGKPNRQAWRAIEETLYKSNAVVSGAFKYDVADVIKKMKVELKTACPLEAGFWHYDRPKPSEKMTIADAVRKLGSWALSGYEKQEMIPSITMIQAFIDSAFGEEAHRINPVIGISSPDDVRSGSVGCFRDYAIPFPDVPLPKEADGFRAPNTAAFQRHDKYHLERASLLTNADKDLYIAIGDALQEQKQRYEKAISDMKALYQKKFDHITRLGDYIEKLPEPQKKESKVKFQKGLYKISSIFSYLRRARKATGQLKFIMYDLEFAAATHNHELVRKASSFNYHFTNIFYAMNGFEHEESRELLSGMSAKLAGRVVLPLISGELDNPSEMYHKLCDAYDEHIRTFKYFGLSEKSLQGIDRTKKFIDCMKFNSFKSTFSQGDD